VSVVPACGLLDSVFPVIPEMQWLKSRFAQIVSGFNPDPMVLDVLSSIIDRFKERIDSDDLTHQLESAMLASFKRATCEIFWVNQRSYHAE
jgi:hypothetical protein